MIFVACLRFRTLAMVRKRSKTTDSKEKVMAKTYSDGDTIIMSPVVSCHGFSEEERQCLRTSLLAWYDSNKRDLPWRKICNEDVNQRAYATWVSEIMLQQTQVATVVSYYLKWMKKWPTLEALAASNIEEVNEAWSGLGYYSRGRRLFEGAQKVVSEMGGQMPRTAQDLEKKLPGVGRYTAGAIASIALGKVTGLVDGNVIRVLSRLRAIGASSTQTEVIDSFWHLANQLVDPVRPGDFNQAMMELGATVCTPKQARCTACPVRTLCQAYARTEHQKGKNAERLTKPLKKEDGERQIIDIECLVPDCRLCLPAESPWDRELGVHNFPRKPKKAEVKQEELNVVVVRTDDGPDQQFLTCQRPQKGLLAGLWEFPTCCQKDSDTEVSQAITCSCQVHKGSLQNMQEVGEVSHQFSHVHHLYKVWSASLPTHLVSRVVTFDDRPVKWLTQAQLQEAALSTGMRKVFRQYENSVRPMQSKKRKNLGDVIINEPKRTQASISDFFKKK